MSFAPESLTREQKKVKVIELWTEIVKFKKALKDIRSHVLCLDVDDKEEVLDLISDYLNIIDTSNIEKYYDHGSLELSLEKIYDLTKRFSSAIIHSCSTDENLHELQGCKSDGDFGISNEIKPQPQSISNNMLNNNTYVYTFNSLQSVHQQPQPLSQSQPPQYILPSNYIKSPNTSSGFHHSALNPIVNSTDNPNSSISQLQRMSTQIHDNRNNSSEKEGKDCYNLSYIKYLRARSNYRENYKNNYKYNYNNYSNNYNNNYNNKYSNRSFSHHHNHHNNINSSRSHHSQNNRWETRTKEVKNQNQKNDRNLKHDQVLQGQVTPSQMPEPPVSSHTVQSLNDQLNLNLTSSLQLPSASNKETQSIVKEISEKMSFEMRVKRAEIKRVSQEIKLPPLRISSNQIQSIPKLNIQRSSLDFNRKEKEKLDIIRRKIADKEKRRYKPKVKIIEKVLENPEVVPEILQEEKKEKCVGSSKSSQSKSKTQVSKESKFEKSKFSTSKSGMKSEIMKKVISVINKNVSPTSVKTLPALRKSIPKKNKNKVKNSNESSIISSLNVKRMFVYDGKPSTFPDSKVLSLNDRIIFESPDTEPRENQFLSTFINPKASKKVCAVEKCSADNLKNPELLFHEIPSDIKSDEWLNIVLFKDLNKIVFWNFDSESNFVCSRHFEEKSYSVDNGGFKTLIPGAMPFITEEFGLLKKKKVVSDSEIKDKNKSKSNKKQQMSQEISQRSSVNSRYNLRNTTTTKTTSKTTNFKQNSEPQPKDNSPEKKNNLNESLTEADSDNDYGYDSKIRENEEGSEEEVESSPGSPKILDNINLEESEDEIESPSSPTKPISQKKCANDKSNSSNEVDNIVKHESNLTLDSTTINQIVNDEKNLGSETEIKTSFDAAQIGLKISEQINVLSSIDMAVPDLKDQEDPNENQNDEFVVQNNSLAIPSGNDKDIEERIDEDHSDPKYFKKMINFLTESEEYNIDDSEDRFCENKDISSTSESILQSNQNLIPSDNHSDSGDSQETNFDDNFQKQPLPNLILQENSISDSLPQPLVDKNLEIYVEQEDKFEILSQSILSPSILSQYVFEQQTTSNSSNNKPSSMTQLKRLSQFDNNKNPIFDYISDNESDSSSHSLSDLDGNFDGEYEMNKINDSKKLETDLIETKSKNKVKSKMSKNLQDKLKEIEAFKSKLSKLEKEAEELKKLETGEIVQVSKQQNKTKKVKSKSESASKSTKKVLDNGVEVIVCMCNREFTKRPTFLVHLNSCVMSGATRKFLCDECTEKFFTKEALVKHKQSLSHRQPGKFFCPICKIPFTLSGTRARHMRTAHGIPSSKNKK